MEQTATITGGSEEATFSSRLCSYPHFPEGRTLIRLPGIPFARCARTGPTIALPLLIVLRWVRTPATSIHRKSSSGRVMTEPTVKGVPRVNLTRAAGSEAARSGLATLASEAVGGRAREARLPAEAQADFADLAARCVL